ncbi:MAG: hypothetical protein GY777_29145, partial [Candidatus Brocadiaceae bacterium]|nr:hypothetical protein [Candidatus Brocadiaceae bacterium]
TTKELTIAGLLATTKVYDGSTTATLTGGSLVGVISPDDVTPLSIPTTGDFASKDVGTNKSVSFTAISLTGADVANYTITQPTVQGDITTKELTITGLLATTKVYDGTTTATLTGGALLGVISPDDVAPSIPATGDFSSKDVGANKSVSFTVITLTGSDNGNYTLTQPIVQGDITTKELTITGLLATTKIYDGSTTAALTGGSLVGVITPDDVTPLSIPTTGNFASKDVGTNKSVSFTAITLTGADVANYTITQPTVQGDITTKELTITGLSATTK